MTQGHTNELRPNALGLLSTAALTAAYMGPALSIYALFGPMTEKVGTGVGFVLIIATGLTLLSAISFGMLAKEMPSAGRLYAWSSSALGSTAGLCLGLHTIAYFLLSLVFCPIIFGQFFNEVLTEVLGELGVTIPPDSAFWLWSWSAGAVVMMALGAYVTYRGIVVSAHLAFTLLVIELLVVIALAMTFLGFAIKEGNFTLTPITLHGCQDGWKGVFLVLPMGLMCMVCDAAVPAAEETENARRTIPIAIVLTCFIIGIWYVAGFSALAMARKTADVPVSAIQNGIAPMALRVWGRGEILVSLTAMTASLGAYIPIVTASSRMIFALARDRKLPTAFARLHPRYSAPWNAIHVAFVCTLLGIVPVFILGANSSVDWWSHSMGWFIGIVYAATNLVNVVYYWRFARSRFHPILNFLVPGTAFVVQIWIIWQSAYVALQDEGIMGQSAQIFMLATSAVAIAYSLWMRNRAF